jgi:hypothetical protein
LVLGPFLVLGPLSLWGESRSSGLGTKHHGRTMGQGRTRHEELGTKGQGALVRELSREVNPLAVRRKFLIGLPVQSRFL